MNKHKIPGIGMRIIKSAIAVCVCYIIHIIRAGDGMVFYSQLAALWCIQMYSSNTMKNAIQRTIGTLVGAVFGLAYLLLYKEVNGNINEWSEAMIISLMIVAVLYTTVLLKKKQASYFSCVVFLSIVVNHVADANPYIFVWNRFLDTMIGIAVGILVNDFRINFHPDKETLFVSGLDDTLLDKEEMLSAYSKVELNRMIDSGMKFTVSTMRTPASILEKMRDVHLNLPVIAMDGAVLYDTRSNAYLKAYIISSNTSRRLMYLISREELCWYANVIVDDTLLIYYGDMTDEINNKMVDELKISPFRNYVKRPLPYDENVAYFMILDREHKVNKFMKRLKKEGMFDSLRIITYPSDDYPGYSYIKIYNKNASRENMIKYLLDMSGLEKIVTFGSIKDQYDVYVDVNEDGANRVVKEIQKRYEPVNLFVGIFFDKCYNIK